MSGIVTLDVDPLGAVGCRFGPLLIGLVCPGHPMVDELDCDLGNLKFGSSALGPSLARPHVQWAVMQWMFWCLSALDFLWD